MSRTVPVDEDAREDDFDGRPVTAVAIRKDGEDIEFFDVATAEGGEHRLA